MSHRTLARCAIFANLAFTAIALPARAADVDNGHKLAERWCSPCHVVSAEQKSASADVPTFATVATKYATAKDLATFLASPYPRMPNLTLSQPEIADLVAYIRTLGPVREEPARDKDVPPPDPRRG